MKRIFIVLFSLLVSTIARAGEPDKTGGQLFFTDLFSPTFSDGFIEEMNSDGRGLESLVATGGGARGIAVDSAKGEIYWSDVNRHVISKANLDGKRQKDIVTTGLVFPYAVDIDLKHRKIYWSDQSQNQIGRANLDGTYQTVIINFPCAISFGYFCTAGGGLAIDSVNNRLYWTTAYCSDNLCSTYPGDILRSHLDGSNIEIVVRAAGRPASIQVDPVGKKIYWTDYVNNVIRRSNLDGTRIDDLFVVGKNNNPNSLALDLNNGYIYWDQDGDVPNRSCIKRMRLNGKQPQDVRCGFGNVAAIEFVGNQQENE
jgi:DNA-binding beta-propeller fold protein YncE